MSTPPLLASDTPEEGTRPRYRWLWATKWLLGIELRTSGRAVDALNPWAISPAPTFICYKHKCDNFSAVLHVGTEFGSCVIISHNKVVIFIKANVEEAANLLVLIVKLSFF